MQKKVTPEITKQTRFLPDALLYQPNYSPWLAEDSDFSRLKQQIDSFTLVSSDRLWTLHSLAQQATKLKGEFWECGVYKGGTAYLLAHVAAAKNTLQLFDTFVGMPKTHPEYDHHRQGDFADTSLTSVQDRLSAFSNIKFNQGFIPDTFTEHQQCRIAFAHIDVDIYQSVFDCCSFIYPRLVSGGIMVFDDYGFPSCPGARKAVDLFFSDKAEVPLVLATGQAIVIKLPEI